MTVIVLQKWDLIKVYRADLSRPHDKFCLCICPIRLWFFYINSDPPTFRKRRQFAIDIANHELVCLTKPVSYLDTTSVIDDLPKDGLTAALIINNGRHFGPISPFLRTKVIATSQAHGALSPEQLDAVLSN